jgi:nicotinamidase-related amidase
MMDALVIIDMQNGCFSLTPRFDKNGIVQRINTLAEYFRRNGKPVIYVQHDGTKENYLFPHSHDWEILPELITNSHDIFVNKTANDAFYQSNLEQMLTGRHIDTLYITGCATDFCVNATIHSALVKDYNQIIIQDCHTTADRPLLTATQIIEFHNWVWGNLTPTRGRIDVKGMHEIIR